MNPPSHAHGHAGYLSGLRPANLKGAVPVFIGAIANGMLRKMIASKSGVGALQSGIGSYVLAFGTAGLVGALGGMLNPRIGQSAMLGAVVEALSGVFGDVAGKVGLSNYGIDGEFRGGVMDGMDDFAVPGQIKNAYVSDPGMTQYPMPMNSSSAFGAAVPAPAYPATAGSFANNPPASAEAMALSGMDANDYLEAF